MHVRRCRLEWTLDATDIPVCHNISEVPKGVYITKKKSGCKKIIKITLRCIKKNVNHFFFQDFKVCTFFKGKIISMLILYLHVRQRKLKVKVSNLACTLARTNTQILHTSFQNEDSRSFTCRRCRGNGNCYFSRRFAAWRRMLFLVADYFQIKKINVIHVWKS